MNFKKLRLYCFSPPVMLATFTVELFFVLYTLWRYGLTPISRLVVLILICLAAFQGAEYLLCGVHGIEPGLWSRLGYSAITLLPPLGIHLSLVIAKKHEPFLLRTAYTTAALFVLYFSFFTPAITGHTCYANYVVFEGRSSQVAALTYATYYYGWLLLGTFLSWHYGRHAKQLPIRRALYALAIGYLAFIIPTTTANLLDPSTIAGIPSIMCGFAVILAFILVGKVTPEAAATSRHHQRASS